MQDASPGYRFAFDIGGTFTDLILAAPDGTATVFKLLSQSETYAESVVQALRGMLAEAGIDPAALVEVVHGTTVATNAILQRRGAQIGLLTTTGFRDVLEIGRLRMPGLYKLNYTRPAPLVPRWLRLEVRERIAHDGTVLEPLALESVATALAQFRHAGVEAVAVSLIHSYANPSHERAIRDEIRRLAPGMAVTLSSDVDPAVGEFERTSTTVTNAYLIPLMERYLRDLVERFAGLGVGATPLIMQSNGGTMSIAGAREYPVNLIESGPAAGVIAAAALARRIGEANIISVDIGGTTAKASVVEAHEVKRSTEFQIGGPISEGSRLNNGGGFAIRAPAIDLAEVGAGGGSIVSIDHIGRLRIGPESAGASPGPVCYGRGGERVTLTDANVCLGYLNPRRLPSGLQLDAEAARAAFITQVGTPLTLSLEDAAHGVFLVGTIAMARAVRAVTIERGRDPRDFAMVAFGGNGPLFAVALARALEIPRVIVPSAPGVFSAVGLLEAEVERHLSRNCKQSLATLDEAEFLDRITQLRAETVSLLREDGFHGDSQVRVSLDMSYQGQSFPIQVPFPEAVEQGGLAAALAAALGAEHERSFGYRGDGAAVQITALRAVGVIPRQSATQATSAAYSTGNTSRQAYFGPGVGWHETPVLARGDLDAVSRPGPLLIEEYDATTLVPPGSRAWRDPSGNIIIEVGG